MVPMSPWLQILHLESTKTNKKLYNDPFWIKTNAQYETKEVEAYWS